MKNDDEVLHVDYDAKELAADLEISEEDAQKVIDRIDSIANGTAKLLTLEEFIIQMERLTLQMADRGVEGEECE